jgi:flagellar basal-body rod protein FlgF
MAPIVGKVGTGVEYNESYTVFEQGSFKETGNPYDVALEDKGFFAVQTPNGIRYTRNGAFTLGVEGLLVTKDGYPGTR